MVMRLDGTFGAFIRNARIKRELTIAAVAERACVSRRHLTELESGANVSVAVVLRVAAVLELNEIDLGGVVGRINPAATTGSVGDLEKLVLEVEGIERSAGRAVGYLRAVASTCNAKPRRRR